MRLLPRRARPLLAQIGPGVVTGAADDDPSGIATYTQAGAQFGYGLLWTVFLTLPFMIAIQLVSARIGRQSGQGIAANLRDHAPRPLLLAVVVLLLGANIVNIGADVAAMAEALQLVAGGPHALYAAAFGVGLLLLQVFVPYALLARVFKWLTLSLLVYVATAFAVRVSWRDVLHAVTVPTLEWSSAYWMMVVALFGTTISPYLFFWQASHEVAELRRSGRCRADDSDRTVRRAVRRMRLDTVVGMLLSNAVAFFIMLVGAAVLHRAGQHEVTSAAQAAAALKPLAGELAFALFAVGIVATGLLAVPVLASSAAYAVAEAFRWREGLEHTWREAPGFYAVVAVATLAGTALAFLPVDPMRALFWSAVVNGVVAVPTMVAMMLLSGRREVMGDHVVRRKTRALGWGAVVLMTLAVGMMGADLLR